MSQISDFILALLPDPPSGSPWFIEGPASRPQPEFIGAPEDYQIVYVSWDDIITAAHARDGRKLRWRGPTKPEDMPRTQILAWAFVPAHPRRLELITATLVKPCVGEAPPAFVIKKGPRLPLGTDAFREEDDKLNGAQWKQKYQMLEREFEQYRLRYGESWN